MSVKSPSSADGWEAKPPFKSKSACKIPAITNMTWGSSSTVLSAINDGGVMILSQTILKKRMKGDLKIMQCSNKSVEVRMRNEANPDADYQIIMTLAINIKGLDCYDNFILFWDGKYAQVYEVFGDKNPALIGTFETSSKIMALSEDSVFQSKTNKIEVFNYQGQVKQMIPLTEQDGEITQMEVSGKHMAVITSNNMIRIFDISRRNIKQNGMTRKFGEGTQCEIKSVALNADGKKLAILVDQLPIPSIRIPDIKFYIYDVEMDTFMDCEVEADRVPSEASWDQNDSRLLCLETEYMKMSEDAPEEEFEGDQEFEEEKKNIVFTGKTIEKYFVTGDYGIKKQDSMSLEEGEETLLGSNIPYLYFLGHRKVKKDDDDNIEEEKTKTEGQFVILRKAMKDFSGLESVDEETKKAILNFSFYLT
jgi:intraflagellar transport protein 140